eukprot:11748057-Alexandrium_andersonii.AAC.1
MLDGALSAHAHSPARGPPSEQTPGKVRVNVRAASGPLVLPREAVDAPWADHQVPDQPGQRCPIGGGGGRRPPAALLSHEPQVRAVQAK